MDIIIVLERLGYLVGEEQSPSPDLSTYQTMVDTWRHTTQSPPTEADMLAEWDVYLAATKYITDREDAMHELLPESVYMPAMLEQAMADRDVDRKTLEPSLEAAVNIYSHIIEDYPGPEDNADPGQEEPDKS